MFRKLVLLCFLIFCMFRFLLFSNATYAFEPVAKVYTLDDYCHDHFSQCKDEGLYNNPSDLNIKEEYQNLDPDSYKFKNKWSDTYPGFLGLSKHIREEILDTFNLLWIGNGCNSDRILESYQRDSIKFAKRGSIYMQEFFNKMIDYVYYRVNSDVLCS